MIDLSQFNLNKLSEHLPKIILGVGLALLAGLIVAAVYNFITAQIPPKFVSSSPKNGEQHFSPIGSVSLIFDRDLSLENSSKLKIEPSVKGTVTVDKKTITFSPQVAFGYDMTYKITVSNPTNSSGKAGDSITISFHTKTLTESSTEERNKIFENSELQFQNESNQFAQSTEGKKIQAKFNLIAACPYDSANFSVEYFKTQDKFFVTIKASPYSQNKQLAVDWIKARGVEDLGWINLEFGSVPGVSP